MNTGVPVLSKDVSYSFLFFLQVNANSPVELSQGKTDVKTNDLHYPF
jgi:hypothetical protein